jgi:hypothetical protein
VKLQDNISKNNEWVKKWRTKVNQNKFAHISFALCNQTCQRVQMGNYVLPQKKNQVKYLGMNLDRRLT